MEFKFTGIILSKYNIGEADRLYSIYTKEAGKIRAKAVGVRKQGAKLAGALENFSLADISIAKKNGTGKVTGSIIENNFANIRRDLDALAIVFEALNIFERLVGFEEKDERVFDLLLEFLKTMDQNADGGKEKIEILAQGFIFKLLEALGYKVEANVCAGCGSKFSEKENYFSAERGGIICANCAREFKSSNILGASVNTIKMIRIFFSNNLKSLAKIKPGKEEMRELKIMSRTFLDWITK